MIINDKYKFVFVHIQKTAGTSITDYLFKIPETKQINHSHSMINTLNCDNYKDYFKFCFVRNPFDRLVSWYNMMINKDIHNDFSKYILENSNNFSEFLDLTNIINETNEYNDNLKTPYPKSISFNQLDYIIDNSGKIQCDFIGKFEEIESNFNKITKQLGFDIKIEHLNKINHKPYREYYTLKDIKKLETLYERDLDYFKYYF